MDSSSDGVALRRFQAAHLLVVFISDCQEAGKIQEPRIQIRQSCAAAARETISRGGLMLVGFCA